MLQPLFFAGNENKRYFAMIINVQMLMKSKKLLLNIIFVIFVIVPLAIAAGCKKQPKCGCEGDVLDSMNKVYVTVFYDAGNNTAQCTYPGDMYTIFYFCNPTDMMGELTKYEQGEIALISGNYFYECSYLINSSNNPYNVYRIYQIDVTALEPDLYGK